MSSLPLPSSNSRTVKVVDWKAWVKASDCMMKWTVEWGVKDVRAQNFPHTDFVKTLTAGRE